jgi:uncharacterized FlaG/YvyC family protein
LHVRLEKKDTRKKKRQKKPGRSLIASRNSSKETRKKKRKKTHVKKKTKKTREELDSVTKFVERDAAIEVDVKTREYVVDLVAQVQVVVKGR